MTESIPQIPIGESSRRVVVFTLELLRGATIVLSIYKPSVDIVVGHMNMQL